MSLQLISKYGLDRWVETLVQKYRVFGPTRQESVRQGQLGEAGKAGPGESTVFAEIKSAQALKLDYASTILPPKKYFLPQKETLFHFEDNGRQPEAQLAQRPTVILGMHTCDLHAVLLLDEAFGQSPPDQHYQARRANTIIVSVECLKPCSEHAFCKDMGTWIAPETYDLHLTDLGQEYALEIGSERGAELLRDVPGVRPASKAERWRFNQTISAKWSRFPYQLEVDLSGLPSLMAISYRCQVWEELGQKCLSCGSCTMVCPTCYCFDVVDEVAFDLASGKRSRVWDSCQFGHFATVAGGHDFRGSRAARLRHRFFHKFKYQPQAYGRSGCVGCGRCAEACLVDIKPIEVINVLQRKQAAQAGQRRETVL